MIDRQVNSSIMTSISVDGVCLVSDVGQTADVSDWMTSIKLFTGASCGDNMSVSLHRMHATERPTTRARTLRDDIITTTRVTPDYKASQL